MFDQGDDSLDSAGFNKDWPEGRAVYHNDSKDVAVWVNEEDHIKIFFKKKGSNLKEMVKQVPIVVEQIEKGLGAKFSYDENFGYLSADPKNLGAGLRMSIHVDLKSFGKDPEGF